MDIVNLTTGYRHPGELRNRWLPHDLKAEKVVFLPDACPGKAPLPTGTAVLTRQDDWRRFAVSDCGCGHRLLRSDQEASSLTSDQWTKVAEELKEGKGGLGDLGGGNHFVDALRSRDSGRLFVPIHTGSRQQSGLVDNLVGQPAQFDSEFERVEDWARRNRASVQETVENALGVSCEVVLDLPHNTYEKLPGGGAIIRKGAAKTTPGDLNVIPAHVQDDVALVRATDQVEATLSSLSHGTGRNGPISEAKKEASDFDFDALREEVLIPNMISNRSLRGEAPYAYRDLEACLERLSGYVDVVERFEVVGYIGHL
jgi:RNA-splicing ligase RtcB